MAEKNLIHASKVVLFPDWSVLSVLIPEWSVLAVLIHDWSVFSTNERADTQTSNFRFLY